MTALDDVWGEDVVASAAPSVGVQAPITTSLDAIWDSVPTPAPTPEPSFLQNVWGDVKSAPSDLWNTIKEIPSGVSNLAHLPIDAALATGDAAGLLKDKIFGTQTAPVSGDTQEESQQVYDRLNRTFRGLGSLGLNVAGWGSGGPAGGSAGNVLFDKLLQVTGSESATTPEQDLANFRKGTVQGTAFNILSKGTGAVLNKTAEALKPVSPEMQQVQSLGIKPSDVKRAAKYKQTIDGETPIEQAVNGATERGVFTGDPTPESIGARNAAAIESLGEQLHGKQGVLAKVDAATPNAEAPTFTNAQKVIEKYRLDKEPLTAQLESRIKTIADTWDGTISDLARLKTAMGKRAFTGLTDSKILDQAITKDLKDFIQRKAEAVSPEIGAAVKDLNSKLSEHYTLEPIIESAKTKALSAEFKPQKGSPVSRGLQTAAKTLGAVSAGGIGATMAGVPLGVSVPVGVGIAGLVTAAKALENPTIARGAAATLKGIAKAQPSAIAAALSDSKTDLGTIGLTPKGDKEPEESVMNKILSALGPSEAQASELPPSGSEAMNKILSGRKKMQIDNKAPDVKKIEQEIDANPYYKAVYQAESGRNPLAKNPNSSASGAFQLINSTAKALGVKDPFDLAQNFEGFKKLTEDNARIIGSTDPVALYTAHYLGAPLTKKLMDNKPLTAKEEQIVRGFFEKGKNKMSPIDRFKDIYSQSVEV